MLGKTFSSELLIEYSNHLFDFIRKVDDDVEFIIKCSMLEIYKETLYDLLNNRANDLKIKENPQKGVYVAGLTEIVKFYEKLFKD